MVAKRKAVVRSARQLFNSKTALPDVVDESMDSEEPEQPQQPVEAEEKPKEKTAAEKERETADARFKELKSMYVDQLKKLIASYDLETGNRTYMMEKIAAHEAKLRKAKLEKEVQIRSVIARKKEELEAISASQLKKACDDAGVTGFSTKAERVQELLRLWQEADGISKALQKIAQDERHKMLSEMDGTALQKLCKKACIDPYVKDIMVARIVRKEQENGRFARPLPEKQQESASSEKQGGDMVDQLLAQAAAHEKELKLKKQQEGVWIERIRELKAMPIENMKKLAKKNGLDDTGKKDEVIAAILKQDKQKAAVAARKEQLKAMSKDALSHLVGSKGLKKGSVEAMINAIIDFEEQKRAKLSAYESKLDDFLAKKATEFEAMSASALKELCANKGLRLGTSKEERVANIINDAREDDEVHKALEKMSREARKEALFAFEKPALLELCEELNVDPLVPEVMVELLLEHEIQSGDIQEPATKKTRVSK